MTLQRAPVTVEHALDTIAGLIGWAEVARICERREDLCRAWSNPSKREQLPAAFVPALDHAFAAAGGGRHPLCETLATLTGLDDTTGFACQVQLSYLTQRSVAEGGEAFAALIGAARPGATRYDYAHAAKQVEELDAALSQTLPLLLKGAGPEGLREGKPSMEGGAE